MELTTREFSSTFSSIKKEFEDVNQTYSATMSALTEGIKFDTGETDDIKEKLILFAAEQDRVANYESLSESFLRKVAAVPGLGKVARKSADSIRTQRLSDSSVAGLVGAMYDGLQTQATGVEATEKKLVQIQETTKATVATMEKVANRITPLLTCESTPALYKSRVMRMDVQLKVAIEKSYDKIETLHLIISSTRACLTAIYEQMPISKADLLSDLAIRTGVSQINELSQGIKDMGELGNTLSNSTWTATQKSLVNLLEMNTMSEKDIAKIKDNADKREQLRLNTLAAAETASKQLLIAHSKVKELAVVANHKRESRAILLEDVINV